MLPVKYTEVGRQWAPLVDPSSKQPLPDDGGLVPDSPFWRQRLDNGDVELVDGDDVPDRPIGGTPQVGDFIVVPIGGQSHDVTAEMVQTLAAELEGTKAELADAASRFRQLVEENRALAANLAELTPAQPTDAADLAESDAPVAELAEPAAAAAADKPADKAKKGSKGKGGKSAKKKD